MSTIEEAMVARMAATAAITALIGSTTSMRLYPLAVPQTATLPAMAYQKISSPKEQSQSGSSHLARSRFQLTLIAETYAGVKALATAVKQCWDDYHGTVSGVRIDHCSIDNDTDSQIERQATAVPVVRIDVLVWHYE